MPSRSRRTLACAALATLILLADAPGALAAPGAFSKISPANGATGVSTTPTVTWGPSSGVSYYEVCANTAASCPTPTSWTPVGTGTSATWPFDPLDPGTTYYWQVRAVNPSTGTTYANGGTWWSFTTMPLAPGAFAKTAPAHMAAGQSTSPTLTWGASARATGYEYCLDTTGGSTCDTSWVGTGAGTSAALSSLSYATTYYWQVRATNLAGTTTADGGTWWYFTTQAAPPGAFNKASPASGATGVSRTPTMTWGASTNVTRYEVCANTSASCPSADTWTSVGNVTSATWPFAALAYSTTYYWQVRAIGPGGTTYANGGSWWSFTTVPPAPGVFGKTAPANAATGVSTSPTLSWGESSNAGSYEYCIDTTANSTCDGSWLSVGAGRTAALSSLAYSTTYYWQARAVNAGGTTYADGGAWWSFTTHVAPPAAFNKASPANGAAGVPLVPTVTWGSSTGATSYEVCGNIEPSCPTPATWTSVGNVTTATWPFGTLAYATTYYWQVRAVNSGGTTYANGGTWWSFTTLVQPPSAFDKVSPAHMATSQGTSPTLTWASSARASSYEYCLTTSGTSCDTSWISTGAGTSASLNGLNFDSTYYWQVRATNAGGTVYANGGAWWYFTTQAAPPGAFGKITPANGATGVPVVPTVTWGTSTGATRYEVCGNIEPACPSPELWTSVGNLTTATWPFGTLAYGTTYFWQVRAINGSGTEYADGGAWWHFTTGQPPAGAFSKLSPSNGAANQSTSPILRWSVSASASGYEYCVDTTGDSECSSTWIGTGTRTFAPLKGLQPATTYYWQVRAAGAGGDTLADTGTWWSMTTVPRTAAGMLDGPPATATGEVVGDLFGYSAASAGDVNGDGFADVVVGAPDSGFVGRAYVFLGGPGGIAQTAATTLSGLSEFGRFGNSVAAAGDVNGDGFGDVIVGSPDYAGNSGRADVYLGGPGGLATAPAWTTQGAAFEFVGYVVSSAGDVNGDGYADVLVGAPGHDEYIGGVSVYLGGPGGLEASPVRILTGEYMDTGFGGSLAAAGDVNNDGYGDVVVGADAWISSQGRAYVYLGASYGVAYVSPYVLDGEAFNDCFGVSVASAGDVNGDGYADVVVGAQGYSGGAGRAYVYLGGPIGVTTTPATTLTGEATTSYFGDWVASAGDVNGDGYADLAVGAPGFAGQTGRAYVYLGAASGLSTTAARTLTGETALDWYGWPAASAGDVNGDGFADVVAASLGYDSHRGRVYVYLGGTDARETPVDFTGDGTSDILWRHTSNGDMWLWPMAGGAKDGEAYVGIVADGNWEIRSQDDLDGDGTTDLLWRHKLDGTLYYWRMQGGAPVAQLYVATVDPSYEVAGTGDFDGDGKADILWRNPTVGDLWLWRMNGADVLGQQYVDTVDASYAIKGLGDLDGDRKTDLLWMGAGGDIWAWLMDGAVKSAQAYVTTLADASYQLQQVADFDADLKADLLWWNSAAGDVWIWRMDGADVLSEHYVGLVAETNYRIQAAGDYNGDRKADILWRNIVAGDLWVWIMNGPVKESEAYVGVVADQGYQIVR